MYRKDMYKAIVTIAVVMAFVMPVAAFANIGTGVTSNSESTGDMEIIVEASTNSDTRSNTNDMVNAEDTVNMECTVSDLDITDDSGDTGCLYIPRFPPAGWTILDLGDETGDTWMVKEGDEEFIHSGIRSAHVCDNNCDQDEWLITPELTLPSGSPTMEFYHYWKYSNYDNADNNLKISTDGGSTWTILDSWFKPANFVWFYETYDLSTYAGMSVKLAWQYVSNYGEEWYIDDIDIAGVIVEGFEPVLTTIYVDDDNTAGPWDGTLENPYQYIQDGINNSDLGDTIYVFNGVYYECVTVDIRLNLVGESRENTIIDGIGGDVVYVTATDVSIDTFTITNGSYGIWIDNMFPHHLPTNTIITNCDVYNNKDGIYTWWSPNCNITNCNAYNNSQHGIYIEASRKCTIMNCSAYNNSRNGIYFAFSASNNIINCSAYNNSQYGIYPYNSLNSKLRNNTIYDNTYNFDVHARSISYFYQDIDTSNTINGKPIYYLVEQSDLELNETHNFAYLGMVSCTNITAKNSDVWGVVVVNTSYSTISNISSHNSANGIRVFESSNCNIVNCSAYNNDPDGWCYGIYLEDSSNCSIINCSAYNNKYGIRVSKYLTESSNNSIINCDVYNTFSGIGISIDSSPNCSITNCDSYNNSGNIYGIYGYGIMIGYSPNCSITNCNAYNNNEFGIRLDGSPNCNITNCSAYNNSKYGSIFLYDSPNCNIINCSSYNNSGTGIYLEFSPNCSITNCDVHNNLISGYGSICIRHSSNNIIITNCDVYNNSYRGIYLDYSSNNNSITNCDVYNNSGYGIYIRYPSDNNSIHHNNFVNNGQSAYDECSNTWDDGVGEGNYWSDYTGIDADGDGIGDTPYNITGKTPPNHDRYPSMFPIENTPPVITDVTATPEEQKPDEPVNITCTVTDNLDKVDTVKVNISGPDGFALEATMSEGSYYYEDTYVTMGVYHYFIWANDTSGNNARSAVYHFEIAPEYIEVTTLSYKWNMISIPFDYSVAKADIIVEYDGTDYTWVDAVTEGIVADTLYGWNRITQVYLPSVILDPGYGYWLWAYNDCTLKVAVTPAVYHFEITLGFIEVTTLSYKWNMVAVPFDYSVAKADIWVEYDGSDYTWADAVTEGIVADTLYGWNRLTQVYLPSVILDPGYGYWLWAYNDCILKVLV